jgi:transposase
MVDPDIDCSCRPVGADAERLRCCTSVLYDCEEAARVVRRSRELERSRLSGHRDWLPDSSGVLEMGSTRRRFTEEYKDQAVAFVIEGNRSVADVARNIGVHEMTLGKWVKLARDAQAKQVPTDAPLNESERTELIRLRAELKDVRSENAELQMQVEFAKKVATWFAKGKQ